MLTKTIVRQMLRNDFFFKKSEGKKKGRNKKCRIIYVFKKLLKQTNHQKKGPNKGEKI